MSYDVDYELEEFYIYFKKSMLNFYKKHTFSRPLERWSNHLNILKTKKEYKNIQTLIIKIISLYAIDLMRVGDEYNASILNSNIIRFNRLEINGVKMKIDQDKNVIFLLFEIFIIFSKKKIENFIVLFEQVELYTIYNNFDDIIDFSIKHNLVSVLDKLLKYPNILKKCIERFGLKNLNHKIPISGRKFKVLLEKIEKC